MNEQESKTRPAVGRCLIKSRRTVPGSHLSRARVVGVRMRKAAGFPPPRARKCPYRMAELESGSLGHGVHGVVVQDRNLQLGGREHRPMSARDPSLLDPHFSSGPLTSGHGPLPPRSPGRSFQAMTLHESHCLLLDKTLGKVIFKGTLLDPHPQHLGCFSPI